MRPKVNLGMLKISSPAFSHGDPLPDRYTISGKGISPPLKWTNVPKGADSLVLLCDDPDAPLIAGFCHWVVYDIPCDAAGLDEDAGPIYLSGTNGAGELGWIPPGAPVGHGRHFYYFHLYAVRGAPVLESGLTKEQLLSLIDEHVVEQARIVGSFCRD